MSITAAIKVLMMTKGETLKQLAEATGIPYGALSMKLQGRRNIKLAELQTILKHYRVTPEQLYMIFFED